MGEFLGSNKSHKIFTPNPEMLVDAQKDDYFKEILNGGDLNICDGFGLSLVGSFRGRRTRKLSKPKSDELQKTNVNQITNSSKDPSHRSGSFRMTRIAGVDFMIDICALAEKENKTVYFLGGGNEKVISNLKFVIGNKFPSLKIAGAHIGYKLQVTSYKLQYDEEENDNILHNIIMSAPDILFVAFGHGKQEKWIHENLKDLPSVKIAMGVGGSFDFISGKVKRAPKFLQKLGLEWLYRLAIQPSRFHRIFKATFVFIYYFLKSVISNQ